jgi:hypothetical protein
MFRKTLAASTLALSLALSPITATPAAAGPDGEDLARAAIGLLIIGAIASAARDNTRDERADRDQYRPVEPIHGRVDRGGNGRGHDRDRHHAAALPQDCVLQVRTSRGTSDAYGRRCVERAGFRTLPAACAFDVQDRGRTRTVYGSRCLSEYGYRTTAHWR